MPYIHVKMWPKTDDEKKAMANNLVKAITDALDCPAEYVTLSMEEIAPEKWEETVGPELEERTDQIYFIHGEKKKPF